MIKHEQQREKTWIKEGLSITKNEGGRKLKGIYLIKNVKNSKCYVGKSVNIETRVRSHFLELKRGKSNKKMQKDYNEFGEFSFETKVLEIINEGGFEEQEDFYIKKYKCIEHGYNSKTAKALGYKAVGTSVNNDQYDELLKEASKENASVASWIRKVILERIDQHGK